jgi:hypothetical protein
VIQYVCASSEVALEPWRSCSLLPSALVQAVVLTEASTTYVSLEVEVEVTLRLTVSMSWYRVPMWDLRPDITSWRNVTVWNLRSCICGAPSLTIGRICNLQCNHSIVRVAQNPKPYSTVSSETPPTWSRSRSHFTTDDQSVSMSWYRAPLWDLRPDITSCRNVAVWNLRACICGAPSQTIGRVCNL